MDIGVDFSVSIASTITFAPDGKDVIFKDPAYAFVGNARKTTIIKKTIDFLMVSPSLKKKCGCGRR
jgi:hypothetical protein